MLKTLEGNPCLEAVRKFQDEGRERRAKQPVKIGLNPCHKHLRNGQPSMAHKQKAAKAKRSRVNIKALRQKSSGNPFDNVEILHSKSHDELN